MFNRDNHISDNQVVGESGDLQTLGREAGPLSFENELSDLWQPDAGEKNGAGPAPEVRLMEQGRIRQEFQDRMLLVL